MLAYMEAYYLDTHDGAGFHPMTAEFGVCPDSDVDPIQVGYLC